MFKDNKKYIYIFLGLFVLIIATQYLLPKPVKWNRTFLVKDKQPFGCFAIYNLLEGVFTQDLETNSQTFYNLKNTLDGTENIVLINDAFNSGNFGKNDMDALVEMVSQGNNVLMAASDFDGIIADTFHLQTSFNPMNFFMSMSMDSMLNKPGGTIQLTAKNRVKKNYTYPQLAQVYAFSSFDSTRFTVLATISNKKACLIRTSIGEGNLYLLSVPDVFGNYFIVNNKNRELAYSILSMLPDQKIIWDEYYKTYNVTKTSPLKFIFQSDALYAAYATMFIALIIYMFTEGRRRQKAIPVLEPVKNTTLEFVEVISHVYFNNKNHQHIAAERIKYFYENIRKKFSLRTAQINELFLEKVTELSGVEYKLVKQLFVYCEKIKASADITEFELIELDRQINNFNKNSLR